MSTQSHFVNYNNNENSKKKLASKKNSFNVNIQGKTNVSSSNANKNLSSKDYYTFNEYSKKEKKLKTNETSKTRLA